MPLIRFRSEDDHTKALDVVRRITIENEYAPLEERVTGVITRFEGKSEEPYTAVYAFSAHYLSRLMKAGVQFWILNIDEHPEIIVECLSSDGKVHFGHVWKYRKEHLYL